MSNESLNDLLANIMADQERRQQHRAGCTKRPCRDCGIFVCPRCRGEMISRTGATYLIDGETRMGVCQACAQREQRAHELRPALDSIPEHFRWAKLGTPELSARLVNSELIVQARRIAGLHDAAFWGRSGSGKTSLAVALLRALIDLGLSDHASESQITLAKWIRFVDCISLDESYAQHPLGRGPCAAITSAQTASLLLLDDVGQETNARLVIEVISHRHNHNLPTWITTFLTKAEAVNRYGAGIARRMFESAPMISFESKQGPSLHKAAPPDVSGNARLL